MQVGLHSLKRKESSNWYPQGTNIAMADDTDDAERAVPALPATVAQTPDGHYTNVNQQMLLDIVAGLHGMAWASNLVQDRL